MKKLDEITIADLMPDSISSDREVSATARAIDPQLKVISEGVDLPLILASIDTLSEGVLEHLAAQYDLTAWDSAWPIDTKRAVLKTAIADKRKKGTRGAVQRAIEAVAPLATITEWWQKTPQGTPHTFEIDVLQDGEAVDAETVADVIAQVNDSKPVRSHFTFSVGQKAEGNMYLSGVIRTIAYARVRSSGMTAVQTEIDAGVLAALRGMNIRRIMEFSHMGDMPEPTPPQPTDRILLYFLSGTTIYRQGSVTKTSSPNSNNVYPMYTSETVQDSTTLFVPEQDKVYKAGSIVDGDIKSYSERYPTRYVDKLSDMPSSTTFDGNADVSLNEFVDGGLWIASNYIYESRMVDKVSQWFKIKDAPIPITYQNPITNNVYAKWRGNDTSNPNYQAYFTDVNGVSIGSFYMYGTYMNKFYLEIPNDKYVSDTITGVTVSGRYFARASSSSSITSSATGILILRKDSNGWYVILSYYYSDIPGGHYALDGSITLIEE